MRYVKYFDTFWGMLALLVLARIMVMPLYPLLDLTEGRYAEMARQMVVSGDWLTPKIWIEGHLMPFIGKPPFGFWVEAACMTIFGVSAFAARFASLLGGCVAVGMVYWVCRCYLDRETAVIAALVTLTSGVFYVVCGCVGVDMVLSGFVAVSFFAYFAWLNEKRYWPAFGWSVLVLIGFGLMFLTKGFVGLITFLMPVVVWHLFFGGWKRVLTNPAWLIGGIVALLIAAPWFILEQIRMEKYGIDFIRHFIIEEHFRRFVTSGYYDPYGYGHKVFRGGAVLLWMASCAPWPLLIFPFYWKLPAFRQKWSLETNWIWRNRTEAFFFFGFAVNVLFWCFARQFLITYMLPLTAMFGAWFALNWRACFPQYTQAVMRLALGIGLAISFGMTVYALLLFDWISPEQKVDSVINELVPLLDPLQPEGKPWRLMIVGRAYRSAPYFYGSLSGRLITRVEEGYFELGEGIKQPNKQYPYFEVNPVFQDYAPDTQFKYVDLIEDTFWPSDVLGMIDSIELTRMVGVPSENFNIHQWEEDHRYMTFGVNFKGKKGLIPCGPDSYPHLEWMGDRGTWGVFRVVYDPEKIKK